MRTNLLKLSTLLPLLISIASFGQLPCGRESMTSSQRQDIILQRENYNKIYLASSARKVAITNLDSGVTYLPIRAHIVQKDGEGLPLSHLNNGIAITNKFFRDAGNGIQFYLAGISPNYIEDSTLYNYDAGKKNSLGNTDEQRITGKYGARNAINVYFFNNVKTNGHGTDVGGYAYFPDTANYSNHVFMVNSQSNDNITLPHEMGHYLQLAHTFDSSADPEPTVREIVTRNKKENKHNRKSANCATNGDLICDTPSDPYDRVKSFFKGCTYDVSASKTADINDDAYTPMMNNIMAYFQCGTFMFTPQQLEVMGGVALKARLNVNNKYVINGANSWQPTNVKAPILKKPTADSLGVKITWRDKSTNETGFFIERAKSKTEPFYAIGGVEPNDTVFIDKNVVAKQMYYYRIKPSNTTTNSLSEVDSINVLITSKGRVGAESSNSNLYSEGNKDQIIVFPNPSAGQEFYVSSLGDIGSTSIAIYSMTGQSVLFKQKTIDAQTVSIEPVQKLISGVYLIVSESEGKVNAVKVVIE